MYGVKVNLSQPFAIVKMYNQIDKSEGKNLFCFQLFFPHFNKIYSNHKIVRIQKTNEYFPNERVQTWTTHNWNGFLFEYQEYKKTQY